MRRTSSPSGVPPGSWVRTVVTLSNYYRRKPAALRDAESHGVPIYVL